MLWDDVARVFPSCVVFGSGLVIVSLNLLTSTPFLVVNEVRT